MKLRTAGVQSTTSRALATTLICALLTGINLASAQDSETKLAAFFKEYLDRTFRLRPMEATQLGDHRFDDLLEDLSPAARAAWTEQTRQTLAALPKAVDYKKLSRAAQIDYEILEHELTKSLWLDENTHPFEDDPRVYSASINQ